MKTLAEMVAETVLLMKLVAKQAIKMPRAMTTRAGIDSARPQEQGLEHCHYAIGIAAEVGGKEHYRAEEHDERPVDLSHCLTELNDGLAVFILDYAQQRDRKARAGGNADGLEIFRDAAQTGHIRKHPAYYYEQHEQGRELARCSDGICLEPLPYCGSGQSF